MGLLTEWVEVNLTSNNIKHFENLGYCIPREKRKNYLISVPKGSKILVKPEHLSDFYRNLSVECQCDNCFNNIFFIKWCDYIDRIKNRGKILCKECSMKCIGEISRKTKLKKSISFKQWCVDNNRQDILDRWDYELNDFGPEDISYKTNKKIYFICSKGIHSDEKRLNNVIRDINSSWYCSKCNSLAYNFNDVLDVWSNKNKISPYDIDKLSSKSVYWKCENGIHEDYKRKVNNSSRASFRCPKCVQERDESFLQERVRLYLKELSKKYDFKLNHECDCILFCRNFITNHRLQYDNEIIGNNFKIIIEVNGEQHYKINTFHCISAKKKGTTLQEELEYQQWKDEYKKQFALDNGYYYLAIPYTADNKNQDWKQMIDETVNYIYENENQNE